MGAKFLLSDDKKQFVADRVTDKVEHLLKDHLSEQTDASSKNDENIHKIMQDMVALQGLNDEISAKLSEAII